MKDRTQREEVQLNMARDEKYFGYYDGLPVIEATTFSDWMVRVESLLTLHRSTQDSSPEFYEQALDLAQELEPTGCFYVQESTDKGVKLTYSDNLDEQYQTSYDQLLHLAFSKQRGSANYSLPITKDVALNQLCEHFDFCSAMLAVDEASVALRYAAETDARKVRRVRETWGIAKSSNRYALQLYVAPEAG